MDIKKYSVNAIDLLRRLIAVPSVSRSEDAAADVLVEVIREMGLTCSRKGNNVSIDDPCYDSRRPTLLLNAHIDTVRPSDSWTRDPFMPEIADGRLYGLGSNDCGGGLVSLLQVFRIMMSVERTFNIIYLASAEEEVSGSGGISMVLPGLPHIDVAIVGEPTGMQPAIAEKGLMVVDLTAHGRAGHAARGEGINSIYKALDDLLWIRDYRFEKVSRLLGPTIMTATVINAGTQHNVVPDKCSITVDVRTNEMYSNEEVFDIIRSHVQCEAKARSFRLNSSHIPEDHPIVRRCLDMGMTPFGSPTLSDQALMPFPSLKLGPGNSARSHTADEYILVSEIEEAIDIYVRLLGQLQL